jgi:preprotein translocase subunit SecD
MRQKRTFILPLIWFLTTCAIIIDFPTVNYNFTIMGKHIQGRLRGPDIDIELPITHTRIRKEVKVWEGLDLQGGIQLVYEADMSGVDAENKESKIDAVRQTIDKRINRLGVTEPLLQASQIGDIYRLIIELPGISNVEEAKQLIGQTGKLAFKEYVASQASTDATLAVSGVPQYIDLGLTGDDVRGARVVRNNNQNDVNNYGKPAVEISFTSDAATKFLDITTDLSTRSGAIAIFLDDDIVSLASVNEPIDGGTAIISGSFTSEQAKNMAIQINEGALAVPIRYVSEKVVSPTLGSESIRKSLIAGVIGIGAVVVLMILYYFLPGFIAVVALGLYTLFSLALFKLIPVTLTMAGVAGFILSIGMAVDASILIFERFKEELRTGKTLGASLDAGFRRAWTSIRDSNISSLLTCTILFIFGTGVIRGFALTLAIGIVVSMFTAIIVTRNFLQMVLTIPVFRDKRWFGIKE